MAAIESFDNIYLDLSKESGKCRFAENGLGWKPAGGGDAFTLDQGNIGGAQWSRAAKGYEVKIQQRNSGILQLDGFQQEDYERLSKIFKNWYSHNLENKEHSVRGWNWGKAEFSKAELIFNVQNRPFFEIPYSEIANTNLAGRNEISVDFSVNEDVKANGNGASNGNAKAAAKGLKAAAGKDQLMEMRFYIPGTTTKKEAEADGEGGSDAGDAEEEKNAVTLFYETLMEKAEIGETAGDTIASFPDVLHLTPRGRFDIDMYDSSFRLRGKTYDYKIQYDAIKKFMVLPKPDDMHVMLCVGLDPPLRQGQTRYPFVVMQFKRDEEVTLDLNLTEEALETRYKDKLLGHYEQPLHQVVTYIFKGLANKKISAPAKDFVTHRNMYGIKCSIKASEGFLYCLEKAFMFVPKPASYISYDQTQSITFSRVGGAVSTLSTFDITVHMKGGGASSQFSNINREDLKALEDFFKLKGLRVKNEIDEESNMIAAALRDQAMDSSDDEAGAAGRADRGSADEDEESVDEDFQAESESDVAEEYDSNHESSGSGSDESDVDNDVDDDDDDDDMDDEEEEEERPKKKKRT
ncbi:FACT complex subunit [Sporothrix eucalyptigena]|uniref:FACT complex subunit POB3 n=1 Tax=Sporothrix eucalyptigena TaxID=1812306 RepID=A0ABP0CJ58_9PEZI